jgi:hypothetical protein
MSCKRHSMESLSPSKLADQASLLCLACSYSSCLACVRNCVINGPHAYFAGVVNMSSDIRLSAVVRMSALGSQMCSYTTDHAHVQKQHWG